MNIIFSKTFDAVFGAILIISEFWIIPAYGDENLRYDALFPDLSFNLKCDPIKLEVVESQFEAFLTQNGLKALSIAQEKKQRGKNPERIRITATDGKDRIFNATSFPTLVGTISVGFVTLPPTRRDSIFEDKALEFVRAKLGCQVQQIERHENGLEAAAFFKNDVARIEQLIEEASKIRK
ncbi:MAG: hypothetical protein HY273_04075 [Gammaproteobacteria bacterium]|nr:hypothetical protein [Gammaproteobacteria bacterium]